MNERLSRRPFHAEEFNATKRLAAAMGMDLDEFEIKYQTDAAFHGVVYIYLRRDEEFSLSESRGRRLERLEEALTEIAGRAREEF